MPPLTDPHLLSVIRAALLENRRFSGYVTWKPRPQEWLRKNLPGCSTRMISELMYQHVESGGRINQVRETRELWLDNDYHFDFVVEVDGREVYVETILVRDEPDDCEIQVVNVHFNVR